MSAVADTACFHCGQPVPSGASWQVAINGIAQPMCCPGCEAVAQGIVDNGLASYYDTREGYAATANQAFVPDELKLYDAPEVLSGFSHAPGNDADMREAVFSIEGIRCAACVWLIEHSLARLPGVAVVNLNVATERLHLRWRDSQCKPSDILKKLLAIGYAAYPYDPDRHREQLRRAEKTLFRRLFIAGLSMMQVMMYAVPAYLADDGTLDADMAGLMRWASLALTAPAVFYSAWPFFKGAWASLKARALGMDVPVALGIAAAFIGSTHATIAGQGDVYFDSVTMFIFLLLCSRYVELLARRKAASALEKMLRSLPASALRMAGYPATRNTETIPAAQLREGDIVMVKPGEAVPADGVIVEGDTEIGLSLLTGESAPQARTVGALLPGGAVNVAQAIVMRVTRRVQESTLSQLVKLVERAEQGKPQLSLWADKVAAWFVAALLLLAAVVFFSWQMIDPARAWPIAIAVLVVSCPCALSLATPSALAAATDRLVRQGVLAVRPHVLETLHRATHVIFDKTGTLTKGRPMVCGVTTLDKGDRNWCLQTAAALETDNAHPLAQAFLDAAEKPAPQAREVRYVPGRGMEGLIDRTHYRLGSAAFVEELVGMQLPPQAMEISGGFTPVYLGCEGRWLARFDLVDTLREDARELVAYFRKTGRRIVLLSGDQHGITYRVGSELGADAAFGMCLPQQKLEFVQKLQAAGAVVAMVGDGINDAAVLAAADVSFAMGSGAMLAQTHADAVLLSGRLSSLADADRAAAQTMCVIKQNLTWATLYNAVAIPAAALGLLNPWLSGIGMSASSALVVINALRLCRVPKERKRRAMPAVKQAMA